MNNPTLSLAVALSYADGISPQLIDEVSDDEMYLGYAAPDCKRDSESNWMIKKVLKQGTVQSICYAEGERLYNKAWTSRYDYQYGINKNLIIEKENETIKMETSN